MLTPDTAHGTNPATVTMAGFEVVKVSTNDGAGWTSTTCARSRRSRRVPDAHEPQHAGPLRSNIARSPTSSTRPAATLYYDGANLNAIMGHCRPGDMGFDIVHVNLHKSFSQPHGGGGQSAAPSRSPIASRRSSRCRASSAGGTNGAAPPFDFDHSAAKSIGRLRGFQGDFWVFVRSYAYIRVSAATA